MRQPVTLHPTPRKTNNKLAACALAFVLSLSGCASNKGQPTTQFDFGPATPNTQTAQSTLGALVVTDVTGSSALDSERMFYRLSYADALQARTYANSRWTANPLQMMTQRLKTRMGQAGAKVLSESDASLGVPILRVDVDDFVHDFSSATQSQGVVAVRASLFQGHTLVDQKSFIRTTPATTLDAAGGARALAASTDAIAADITGWLGTLNLQRR
ncbi:ABC-type transport auxiliary lipoprotein family protein [Herbaspirillum sp. SJZ107]|uniref:ABC-type transport auxiliary lipoprotein family protein n=1 Tax=Herbaspirillum sp. SJZ107 TaxID=2572881 RepID=UPI0011508C4D|nr:ABC-type transport auxiliary lipoprotein family protein [Herbaspirillum sp. SJZ107]